MAKRRVIRGGNRSWKDRSKLFALSFTSPTRFKRYWLNADGARRFGTIAGAGLLFMFAVFLYFAKDLPSPGKINARIGSQNTEFYDRENKVKIFELHGDKNRKVIGFDDMSPNIKKATIAIEDKDFYKHGAFSIFGIGRAFTGVIFKDASRGGGSTITQQYVKNALLSPERTWTRKIKELILALEIEQLYKKDDILKLYLNEIPYGSQAYGIESACRTYFPGNLTNKPADAKCASTLTLKQSAMLAAIPQLPTYYSPYGQNIEGLVERQNIVLDRMVEQEMISDKEAEDAKLKATTTAGLVSEAGLNETPNVATSTSDYPHFSQYTKEYLENKYGTKMVEEGGLRVITTLDIKKQKMAQEAVSNPRTGINAVRRSGGSNVALVSADPKTGQVLAMLGSHDANDPKEGLFNVALANRQPGSSFKPFVYATAFAQNKNGCTSRSRSCQTWGPGSTMYDVPTDFGGGYKPQNYGNRSFGVQSVRTSLAGSLNIPAVKMIYIAGVSNSIKTAKNLGITTLNRDSRYYGLSLVLGSGEVKLNDMVNAYESFANGGKHFKATPVLKVTDPNNRTVEDNSKPKGKQVLDPQVSYLMAHILSDNRARSFVFGANNPLQIPGRTVAAKTGSTEQFNDAWTMGFSPDLVTGVWAGNNDNKPMTSSAVSISAPIWNDYMRKALEDYPKDSNWTRPSGIKEVTLDPNTGQQSSRGRTDLFPSWYKPETNSGVRTARVDRVSGKLATECTPEAAIQTVTAGQIKPEIPATDPLYRNWAGPVASLAQRIGYASGGGVIPTQNDDVHKCSDTKPTVQVSADGSSKLKITANVSSGTHTANKLTIYFDDQVISTQNINGSTNYSFDYTPTSSGSHTIRAVVTDTAMYSGSDETTITTEAAQNDNNSGGGQGGPLTPIRNQAERPNRRNGN